MRNRIFAIVLVFALGVLVGAAAIVSAQVDHANLPSTPDGTISITTDTSGKILSSSEVKPVTLSNADLGLKILGRQNGRVVGKLVARVNGQWVEVQLAPQDSLISR
jgi:hypothetical protein